MKYLAIVSFAWTVLIFVVHAQAPDRQVVVLGSGVACRAVPSLSASVVERLDVADLLDRAAGESGAPDWVPVEVAGGRACFVSHRLVEDFNVDLPERTVIAIVENTARLRGRIPFDRHERRLTWFEIGARWGVEPDWFWALHDRYRDDPLAERIAWTASRQDPPGECEGDVPCYVGRMLYGEFEYLRRHPDGAYVPETLQSILDYLISLDEQPRVSRACKGRGGDEMADRMAVVRPILNRVEHRLKLEIETLLEVLARPC